MWLGISIGLIALVGMSVLFALKARELAGTETALLRKIRRADPLVAQGWATFETHLSVRFDEACRRGYGFCKTRVQMLGVTTHAHLHKASVRFGEYLKKQGVAVSKNPENVSGYMQGMLEYKRAASAEKDGAEEQV